MNNVLQMTIRQVQADVEDHRGNTKSASPSQETPGNADCLDRLHQSEILLTFQALIPRSE
jgi:hypothetical protein